MKHPLKRMIMPAQIVAWFVIPVIMVTIVTAAFAGSISLLTSLTFSEVSNSTPMWIFNVFTGIGYLIATGTWLWEEN